MRKVVTALLLLGFAATASVGLAGCAAIGEGLAIGATKILPRLPACKTPSACG